MIKFQYKPFVLDSQKGLFIFKPIIPIILKYKNCEIGYESLIDSGSDKSYFPAVVGEYLGVAIKKGQEEKFIGAKNEIGIAYFHMLEIGIKTQKYSTKIGFSYDISDEGFGILGQSGLFDNFDVKFSLRNKEITLYPD
jgi:hypothetical protein